ncbi:hypothetical protein K439DRAFT_298609 [Ramaria rubella]|nr:hypothetical protein K439DRAFT_298609 [Ramaria rubella]
MSSSTRDTAPATVTASSSCSLCPLVQPSPPPSQGPACRQWVAVAAAAYMGIRLTCRWKSRRPTCLLAMRCPGTHSQPLMSHVLPSIHNEHMQIRDDARFGYCDHHLDINIDVGSAGASGAVAGPGVVVGSGLGVGVRVSVARHPNTLGLLLNHPHPSPQTQAQTLSHSASPRFTSGAGARASISHTISSADPRHHTHHIPLANRNFRRRRHIHSRLLSASPLPRRLQTASSEPRILDRPPLAHPEPARPVAPPPVPVALCVSASITPRVALSIRPLPASLPTRAMPVVSVSVESIGSRRCLRRGGSTCV